MRGVNFTQTDKWIIDDVNIIREKPSGNKTSEDTYYKLVICGKEIWLDKDMTYKIDEILENDGINLESIKEECVYDFDCTCAEGIPSYNRHGEGRCDGCHGRIFK